MTPISIDGNKNFNPGADSVFAWLSQREIKTMLAVSLTGALVIMGWVL